MSSRHRSWHRYRDGAPPAWWPANEPWPPRGPQFEWRERRAGFLRRVWSIWWLFALSMMLLGNPLRALIRELRGGDAAVPFVPVVLLLALIAVAAFVVTRRIATPIADLVAAADRVAKRDFNVRVPETGPESVQGVARAFNAMATRLDAQDRAQRHLMADIAHELRTPVSVIQGRLEGLIDGIYPLDQSHLAHILEDTRVLSRLIDDLRTLAEAESGTLTLHREPVDIAQLLEEQAAANQPATRAGQIDILVRADGALPLADADPVRLREILANLIGNALRHTPVGGRIELFATQAADWILVRVSDSGEGISAEALPHVFDRSYKGARSNGSGLGLAIVRRLVEAHGGTVSVESRPGQGATFSFEVPASNERR